MDASHSTQANTRLRQARIARNWRQGDLAEHLGTTAVSIKRWERGSHQPSAYYRVKLCALFGKSPQELGLVADAADEEHRPDPPLTSQRCVFSPPSESSARIFVSYPWSDDESGTESARRLIADLQATGVEVVTDDEDISNQQVIGFLHRELARCDYLILIQTPQFLHSPRMQNAANLALQLVTQQRMKGVLRVIITPSENEGEQPPWTTFPAFDASRDYPRARDGVLRALGLLKLDGEEVDPTVRDRVPVVLPSSAPSGLDRPLARPETQRDAPLPPAKKLGWVNQCGWTHILAGVALLTLVLGGVLWAIDASTGPNIDPRSTVDPYSPDSTLALSDDLTTATPNLSQWDVSPSGKAHGCFFRKQTYDVSSQGLNYCVANTTDFANFVYQIQLTIIDGRAAGIIFRTNDGAAQTYYIFEITVDGNYFVQRNDSSEDDTQLSEGNSAAIKTGFHQPNSLAVDANGGEMTFYINSTVVARLTDSRYSSGMIGVIVGEQFVPSDTQTITEAAYNYARVWI